MQNLIEQASFLYDPREQKVHHADIFEGEAYNGRNNPLDTFPGTVSFHHTFVPTGIIAKAQVACTALGIYELFLNGTRVCSWNRENQPLHDEYKPGFGDYRKRVMAQHYDITDFLIDGENNLFAEVSEGWWAGKIANHRFGDRPVAFWAVFRITYQDGREELLSTDEHWECCQFGPTKYADLYNGEYYDATIPHGSLNPAAYPFHPVKIMEYEGEVNPAFGPSVRIKENLTQRPVSATLWSGVDEDGTDFGRIHVLQTAVGNGCEEMTLPPDTHLILDMGQNMVGRPAFDFDAPMGTKITVFVSEFCNDSGDKRRGCDGPQGSPYLASYRSAKARIVYIADGTSHFYTPTFSFFGFRYLEFCANREITLNAVNGQVIGSEFVETGRIVTDNAEVNRLFENALWGMRGNHLSIPTDCPQRNERLGWTGDTQVFCGAGAYLGQVEPFMEKWLIDMRDSQGEEGGYPDVCPDVLGWYGAAGWGDAGIIVPGVLYRMYGKKSILAKHFSSMQKCMDYYAAVSGPNGRYGDWLAYEETEKEYINICYYAGDADCMAEYAAILGKPALQKKYQALGNQIRAAFKEKLTDASGLKQKTQTSLLLTLAFDMLPQIQLEQIKKELREKIAANNYRLSTGFLGTGRLMTTLAKNGMDDLAYDLLLQTEEPSWLYCIRMGATTFWERWNSYTAEKGFGDPDMNSFNHYAYGAVVEWMFAYMAGIRPGTCGFHDFVLEPHPDFRSDKQLPKGQTNLKNVQASYRSPHGEVKAAWHFTSNRLIYEFTVPVGTTATVRFPLQKGESGVTVNGIKAAQFTTTGNFATGILASGTYQMKAY